MNKSKLVPALTALVLALSTSGAFAITQGFTLTITITITPTGISLSTTSVTLPATNAGALVANITVAATGGTYAGTLSLSGTDASKFALSNGGVYPCNLIVGAANICTSGSPCTYNVTVSAP